VSGCVTLMSLLDIPQKRSKKGCFWGFSYTAALSHVWWKTGYRKRVKKGSKMAKNTVFPEKKKLLT